MPEDGSKSPEPPQEEIASWCEEQYQAEEKYAKRQIRLVLVILPIGILLLLAMPRLIQEIDFLWRTDSLPTRLMENAKSTRKSIEKNKGEMKTKLENAKKRKDEIFDRKENMMLQIEEKKKNISKDLNSEYSIFRRVPGSNPKDVRVINKIIESKAGNLIATGFDLKRNKKELLLFVHLKGRKSWEEIRLRKNNKEIHGRLYALLQAADNSYIAGGFECIGPQVETTTGHSQEVVLLLSSSTGRSWKPVQLRENGKAILGGMLGIIQANDGTFIAAGYEAGYENVEGMHQTLLLLSVDGRSWRPVRPKVNGKVILGGLRAIIQADDGTFIAAGYENVEGMHQTLLLLSVDGRSWRPVRPKVNGKVILGGLRAIIQANDGTFIAAGYESHKFLNKALLLLSDDGRSWRPVRPKDNGKVILGGLRTITQAKDDTLVAAGLEPTRLLKSIAKNPDIRSEVMKIMSSSSLSPFRIEDRLTSSPSECRASRDIMFSGGASILRGYSLILTLKSGSRWTAVRLYGDRVRVRYGIDNAFDSKGGLTVAGRSIGSVLQVIKGKEQKQLKESLFSQKLLHKQYVFSTNIFPKFKRLEASIEELGEVNFSHNQQSKFVKSAQSSYDLQNKALNNFLLVTKVLDQALRRVELVREAGQIATRLAIVGLLIYLVQIWVNRYRYHLRLSKFYKARAQALRLINSDTSNLPHLSKASLSELTAALSPDDIDFGKAPKPPDIALPSR